MSGGAPVQSWGIHFLVRVEQFGSVCAASLRVFGVLSDHLVIGIRTCVSGDGHSVAGR